MTCTRTPSSLKWLINKRARLHGEICKIESCQQDRIEFAERKLKAAEQELESAKRYLILEREVTSKRIQTLRANLQSIDATLALHEIQIDPQIISPIRTQDAVRLLPHGKLTRLIFEYLGASNGTPITTTEFAVFISTREYLNLNKNEFTEFKIKVGHRLRHLMHDGKVERLKHAKGSSDRSWILPVG